MAQAGATVLVLVAHAPLASAFQALARHAFPECGSDVIALDIPAEFSLASAQEAVQGLLSLHASRPLLLLVDVQGATPANAVVASLAGFPQARAVAGLNAPMLWRTLCYRTETPEQLVERALIGGERGVSKL